MSDMQQPMKRDDEKLPAQQSASLIPLVEGLERPATVFLSYAREDTEDIKELQLRLNVRGVLCWRDADDLLSGSLFEGAILHAIEHDADAIALLLTPNCLQSEYIWKVEIPAALRRQASDPHFHVVPILHGVSFAEVRQCCSNRNLADISRFQAISLMDDETTNNKEVQQAKWNDAARLILKSALAVRLRRINADRNYEPWLNLKTFASTPSTAHLDLNLDWLKIVYEKERLPTPQEWEHILLPALRDVKQNISEKVPSRRIHLFVQSILPVGIMIGFVFRESARITLLLEGQEETWSSKTPPAEKDPLQAKWIDTNQGNQGDAVVEVATTRSTSQATANAVLALGLKPGHHVRLELPQLSRESVKDAAHAKAIALQIGRICQELCDKHGVTHIHLFVATPVELAVLIGQQLNALCPITLYEYGKQMTYQPVGTLI